MDVGLVVLRRKGVAALLRKAGDAVLSLDGLLLQKFIRPHRRTALHEDSHRCGDDDQQRNEADAPRQVIPDAEQAGLAQRPQRQQRDGGDDTERRRQRQPGRVGLGLGKVVVGLGQRHPGQGRGIVLGVLRLGRVVF